MFAAMVPLPRAELPVSKTQRERTQVERTQLQKFDVRSEHYEYKHLKVLGTGGFGMVRKSFRNDGQIVAIKTPLANAADHEVAARFRNENRLLILESQITIQLRHDNIVKTRDYFRANWLDDRDGHLVQEAHLVLEYCEFGSLYEFVNTPDVPLSWVFDELFVGLLSALRYIDELHHIVHRDIKPDNILVKKGDGGRFVPVLADFGVYEDVTIVYASKKDGKRAQTILRPRWVYEEGMLFMTPAIDLHTLYMVIAWAGDFADFRQLYEYGSMDEVEHRAELIHEAVATTPQLANFQSIILEPWEGEWDAENKTEGRAAFHMHRIQAGIRMDMEVGTIPSMNETVLRRERFEELVRQNIEKENMSGEDAWLYAHQGDPLWKGVFASGHTMRREIPDDVVENLG